MARITIKNLTFSYENNYDTIFDNVSIEIDTNWRLGFIGRNGKGKTTLLKLFCKKYPYQGNIETNIKFEYFPYEIEDKTQETCICLKRMIAPFEAWEKEMDLCIQENTEESIERYGRLQEQYQMYHGYEIEQLIEKETGKLGIAKEALYRPFATLSNGEQTKALLAALFLKTNHYLLIDEPTNHLDVEGRHKLAEYLNHKKAFLLVSHDRAFLNRCIDHVLSINKSSIYVLKGNYDIWREAKERQDQFEWNSNEKLKKEIVHLTEASRRCAVWSDRIEAEKIGAGVYDRGHVGHQAAKMMKRSKVVEKRREKAICDKQKLLKDIETSERLKMNILPFHKNTFIEARELTAQYDGRILFYPVSFQIKQGERVVLEGQNGCGKTTFIRMIQGLADNYYGILTVATGLTISYLSQDTSYLKGSIYKFAETYELNETLLFTVLRQLDFPRQQFEKSIENYSLGQKKKLLLAKSLTEPANLFLWDEPLNYIDIISREQIEELILQFKPTMLFVEHDEMFKEKIATKRILLRPNISRK